jgi:hypothetical protein
VAELTDTWAYLLSVGTNTPQHMTDASGTVTLSGSYTPWGDVLDYISEGNFTWGNFGGMMDASTGLLYVGNGQYYVRSGHGPISGPREITWENEPLCAVVRECFAHPLMLTIFFTRFIENEGA